MHRQADNSAQKGHYAWVAAMVGEIHTKWLMLDEMVNAGIFLAFSSSNGTYEGISSSVP